MAGTGDPMTSHLSLNDSLAFIVNTPSGPHNPSTCGGTATKQRHLPDRKILTKNI